MTLNNDPDGYLNTRACRQACTKTKETSASSSRDPWGHEAERRKQRGMFCLIFWIFSLDLFIQSVTTLRSMEGFSFEFYLLILALMSVSNLNPYVFLFAFTEHCQLSHTDNPSLSRVCCTLENLH